MPKKLTVLLIDDSPEFAELVRRWLVPPDDAGFILNCSDSLSKGMDRLAEGGVDAVLLDLGLPDSKGLETFTTASAQAHGVPIVVLSGGETGLALKMVQQGAQDYVVKTECNRELLVKTLMYAVGRSGHKTAKEGNIIALLGAKGGVGTTTVALSLACILARESTVVLVEMRPTFGSLASLLQAQSPGRNLSHCLNPDPRSPGSVEPKAALWPYKAVPGLSILFGPQTAGECAEIDPGRARLLLQSLAAVADYVIVDLPPSLSEANRAVLEASGSMALVVERDPVCARIAAVMARTIEAWNATSLPLGTVIVSRASVGFPAPLPEIESLLNCRVLGVVPPAPDLCSRAQNMGVPVAVLDPESLISGSLNELSEILAPARLGSLQGRPPMAGFGHEGITSHTTRA
jgi:Flp pilus assembly CpaE family ATPase